MSVITVGELRAGVLVAVDVETRDRRLATLGRALSLEPIPIDQSVAEAWAKLRVLLRDKGSANAGQRFLDCGHGDLIGRSGGPQDNDYVTVPGLEVLLRLTAIKPLASGRSNERK